MIIGMGEFIVLILCDMQLAKNSDKYGLYISIALWEEQRSDSVHLQKHQGHVWFGHACAERF